MIIGRNENIVIALSDLAPLALYVLSAKLNPRVLFSVVLVTNAVALTLNIIKATYLLYPNTILHSVFEAYRLASITGLEYWRFVGVAGQAGQAGLHALLSLMCVLLYVSPNLSKRVGFFLFILICIR